MTERKDMLMEGLTRCVMEKLMNGEVTDAKVKFYVDDMRERLREMVSTALTEIKQLEIDVNKDDFDIGSPEDYSEFQALLLRHFALAIKGSIDDAIDRQLEKAGDK
jgi:hypothetical protein